MSNNDEMNEMDGQTELASGWEWWDFGCAIKTLPDGVVILMEHPHLPAGRLKGMDDSKWVATAWANQEAFDNGDEPIKRWGLAARRSELASKEAELVFPHVMAWAEVVAQRGGK